ncbi:hypothetical protein [Nostoc sp.]
MNTFANVPQSQLWSRTDDINGFARLSVCIAIRWRSLSGNM